MEFQVHDLLHTFNTWYMPAYGVSSCGHCSIHRNVKGSESLKDFDHVLDIDAIYGHGSML